MGFSWAFWLSQEVHKAVSSEAAPDVPEEDYIVDRFPPHNLTEPSDYRCMLYADNGNHLSLTANEANKRREALSLCLNQRGLATHETIEASDLVETLGTEIYGKSGCVKPTSTRLGRIRAGLARVVSGKRAISE